MENLKFALNIMTAIGTFFGGLSVFIGLFKILRNYSYYKNETLYGEEAKERYKRFEQNTPSKAKLLGEYEFGGRDFHTHAQAKGRANTL